MIVQVLIHPSFPKSATQSEEVLALHANWVVSCLAVLQSNGELIVDSESRIRTLLQNNLALLPPRHRKLAITCMEELFKANRIRPLKLSADSTEVFDSCKWIKGALEQHASYRWLLGPATCECGDAEGCPVLRGTTIYPSSVRILDFMNEKFRAPSLIHHDRELSKHVFEQEVLIPVLRNARKVTFVDRLVGSTAKLDANGKPSFQSNFVSGLDWIVEVFLRESAMPRKIELITDVSYDLPVKELRLIADKWEANWKTKAAAKGHSISVKIVIKRKARNSGKLDRDRYLITDQIGLLFSRGFDVLNDDRSTVRDGAVIVMPRSRTSSIVARVAGVPEAR